MVAHPDDESVGAGVLLQRMREPIVLFCTDGGPRDAYFWKAHGSRENYVRVRRHEAESAVQIAGIQRVIFLGFCDQELYRNLHPAIEELEHIVRELRPNAILTHAYEGGHPDHDCCSFLSFLLGRRHHLPVWEMPLYHRDQTGPRAQEFVCSNGRSVSVRIKDPEIRIKRQMVAAHASQSLASFDLTVERFRPQAAYQFRQPPQAKIINYEAWQWSMNALEVSAAFSALLDQNQD